MAAITLTEVDAELTEITAAITAIMGGAQSYAINGKSLTRASYPALVARKKELWRMKRVLDGTGIVTYPILDTRS